MPQPTRDGLTDFLIADLEHFGESLWRNEELGERRLSFFLTLATAIISGLVALHTSEDIFIAKENLDDLTRGALMGLLVFGVTTYLRMLHRNRVTDEYHRTLKHIRDKLRKINGPLDGYRVPQRSPETGAWKWLKGGLAESVAVIDAILLCSLLYSVDRWLAFVVSSIALFVAWKIAASRNAE
jgi:hypothetical protein